MPAQLCVFDAYGTLFDVAGAARAAAAEPGRQALRDVWPRLAEVWRRKQLEYSWIRAISSTHADFWSVTCDALDYAMQSVGLTDDELRTRLRELYLQLPAYPEVPDMLARLREAKCPTAILSNGSPDMLNAAVRSAGLEGQFDAVLSVESVRVYKPSPKVYAMVTERFTVTPGRVLFVSANGWDAASAAGYGFHALWINRDGVPMDRLASDPHRTAKSLVAVPAVAATL